MPTSTADPIAAALKHNFGRSVTSFEESLHSSNTIKRVLLDPVQYDPPSRHVSGTANGNNYILLNPPQNSEERGGSSGASSSHENNKNHVEDTIPRPKLTFFRREDVQVGYRDNYSPGSGMLNVGNTCYLNSTLQALFHTPALVNYLSDGSHVKKCSQNSNGFSHSCTICALSLTLRDTHRNNVIKPSRIYEKLKSICKHLVHGRQEDAHEFLRYLIESLQKSFLISVRASFKTLDNPSKETTPFNQIFGGYMRQDVTCIRCKYVSTTFQHFMDLLLDIRSASNLEEALSQYFRVEKLGGPDGSNMYKCEKCKVKVPAQKCSIIERPPIVLCIQLKRFGLMGGKISKSVQLSRKLEISKHVRNSVGTPLEYRLVSMITHVGPSPNCGHYTAIGEASNGQFYQFDDSHVRLVPVQQALNTASYVVMYEMTKASQASWIHSDHHRPSVNGCQVSSNNSSASSATTKHITNATTTLIKKIVPYDGLDTSEEEENDDEKNTNEKLKTSCNKKHKPVSTNGHNGTTTTTTTTTKTTTTTTTTSRAYASTGFVPRSVALKHQVSSGSSSSSLSSSSSMPSLSQKKTSSSSGTWTVTDTDHHNPSINSDNSTGSVGGGTWLVSSAHPRPTATITTTATNNSKTVTSGSGNKRSESDSAEVSSVNSSWQVKPVVGGTASTSDAEVTADSPKKKKKLNVVKNAITNTWGKIFSANCTNKRASPSSTTAVSTSAKSQGVIITNMTNGDKCESSGGDEKKDDDLGEDDGECDFRPRRRKKRRKNDDNGENHGSSASSNEQYYSEEDSFSSCSKRKVREDPKKEYNNGNSSSSSSSGSNNSTGSSSSNNNNNSSHQQQEHRWDGKRVSNNVVDELIKQSSFGDRVTGWDGNKSFSNNGYYRQRRDSRDRYDDELDRGRVKKQKIKRRFSDPSFAGNDVNHFQIQQNHHYDRQSQFFYSKNRYHWSSQQRNHVRKHNHSFDETSKYRRNGGYRHKDYHHSNNNNNNNYHHHGGNHNRSRR